MKKTKRVDTNQRKKRRKNAQQKLQRTVGAMLSLPDECVSCKAPFDKKSREMANTWNVMVYEQQNKIYLTCPGCWDKVNLIVEEKENEQL